MHRTVLPLLALVGAATTSATSQAADWSVYTQTQAGAYGAPSATDIKCSGTNVSQATCGQNGQVLAGQRSLTSSSSVTTNATIYNLPNYQHGDGYAAADLASGKLRISDHAESQGAYRGEGTYGIASANFSDTLTFQSTATDPFLATVRLHIDGLIEGYQQPRFGFTMSNPSGSLYGNAGWYDASDGIPSCIGNPTANCVQQAGFLSLNASGNWIQFGPSDFIGTIMIDPQSSVATIGMYLSAGDGTDDNGSGVASTYAEFGHTASINFDLPEGVTFTSASGVFLTANADPALPEPTTWATLITGFGLVGGAMRRRGRLALA